MKAIHYLFATLIILLLAFYAVLFGYNYYVNRVIDYSSSRLVQFSDGVKYDETTKTIYTSGKIAKWQVKLAQKAFYESGDKEFWMDNNSKHNYKCVLVKNIVYGK